MRPEASQTQTKENEMPVQPVALRLWVQPDTTMWVDYKMDEILDRDSEMARLEAFGDWCDALHVGATHWDVLITADALEAPEGLPVKLEVERPDVQEKGVRVVSMSLRVDDKRLTRRPELTDAGILWVEPRRQEAPITLHPPVENVKQGWTCEQCKRFSLDEGQRWFNEVTHPFSGEGQSRQMWRDVVGMIGQSTDVQLPNNPAEWGACLEHSRLIEKTFPGCDKFVKRVVYG
jgi:hypothetical protein